MKTEELEDWALDWAPTTDFQNPAWLIPQGTPSSPQAGPPDFKNALSLLQFRELMPLLESNITTIAGHWSLESSSCWPYSI